jgi:hypothetical protein
MKDERYTIFLKVRHVKTRERKYLAEEYFYYI